MGPLSGFQIIELAGLGPGPMAAMMLADMGAEVIVVDRMQAHPMDSLVEARYLIHRRGKQSIRLDLRSARGVEVLLRLVSGADGLIDPFRPGVAERLGIGPEDCARVCPRLVYGRITGWGQEGPLASRAGHDINYIAVTGLLEAIGREGQKPAIPLNLVGDYGGGAMLLAFGMACAFVDVARTGMGQVVDAAMVDGAATLFGAIQGLRAGGIWGAPRGRNLLDSGAPFYEVYETADHKHVAVGAIEPQFYRELLARMGVDERDLPAQMDEARWPSMKKTFERIFRTRTRDEWCSLLEGCDACFSPVLDVAEAPLHSHARARRGYIDLAGVSQPAPAPRFSRTVPEAPQVPCEAGAHTDSVLRRLGFSGSEIEKLRTARAVA